MQVPYTAVVMAGRRGGQDPVAVRYGVSHKCLVDAAGKPMLLRVLETLEACPGVATTVLCVDDGLRDVGYIDERIEDGRLSRLPAAASPAASAERICHELAFALPLLVVTADHPLLDVAMLRFFCDEARNRGDVVVGVARAGQVLDAYPGATRTLLRFSDGPFCGCNLFALNTGKAAAAARFWTRLEAERKRPGRLVRTLGPWTLLRYLTGTLTLARAIETLSRRLDVVAGHVVMPFADAAIDVDRIADLELVERILRERDGNGRAHS